MARKSSLPIFSSMKLDANLCLVVSGENSPVRKKNQCHQKTTQIIARGRLNNKETPLQFIEDSLNNKEGEFLTVLTRRRNKKKGFHVLTAAICKHFLNLTLTQMNALSVVNRAHIAVNLFLKI